MSRPTTRSARIAGSPMPPGWLPADWTVDADGAGRMALCAPLPIGEALILREFLITTSCERQRGGDCPR